MTKKLRLFKFFKKFLLRKDIHYKIKEKFSFFIRRNFKDAFKDQKQLLNKLDDIIIFDVGSHTGNTVNRYRSVFPNSQIFAFEPTESSYKKLINQFDNDKKINVSLLGLSNKVDKMTFYLSESDNLNSFKEPNERAWGFEKEEITHVNTNTIDNFCDIHNIKHIDILKLDVQGSELDILKGSQLFLSESKIGLIYLEWQVVPLYKGHSRYFKIGEYLERYGYEFFNLYNINEATSGQLRWGDSIYINTNIRQDLITRFGRGQGSGW